MLPARFIAGDSLSFTKTLADYPASAGWALALRLLPRSALGDAIDIATTAEGDSHVVDVAPAVTVLWNPGVYSWVAWVADGTRSVTLETGETTLLADPRTSAAPLDLRSDAVKALDNVQALIRGKASRDVYSYQFNGRELRHYTMDELLKLEAKLVADVKRERAAEDKRAGKPSRNKVYVRLARA